jgi:peptide chain release factor 3
MDREARDPFELMEEIEKVLGINTYPINWPIGSGRDFKGVYDRESGRILAFTANGNGQHEVDTASLSLDDADLESRLGSDLYSQLKDDVELLDGAGSEFDMSEVSAGRLSPVFFGSALTNFGVEPFLQSFLQMTSSPLPRKADTGEIDPFSKDFSAFVFKIQANMNKAHRDRIAFMRICSGKFEKGIEVYHVQGDRKQRLSQPQQLMAQDREVIEEAYAGDIIGVFDPGIFSIGDTISMPGKKFRYEGIPTFAPEHFALVRQVDTMKRKQFVKGTTQIAQEGAIQIFQEPGGGMEEVIVGVVGTLQFEVLEYRLKNEYAVDIRMDMLPYQYIRWIENEEIDLKSLNLTADTKKIQDIRGKYLLLSTSPWNITWALEHNPDLRLSEFGKNEE